MRLWSFCGWQVIGLASKTWLPTLGSNTALQEEDCVVCISHMNLKYKFYNARNLLPLISKGKICHCEA